MPKFQEDYYDYGDTYYDDQYYEEEEEQAGGGGSWSDDEGEGGKALFEDGTAPADEVPSSPSAVLWRDGVAKSQKQHKQTTRSAEWSLRPCIHSGEPSVFV